jgi:hypothetical protein
MESGMVEISEGGGEPEGVEETGEVEGAGETGEVEEIEGAGDSEEPEEFEPDASTVEYPDCSSAWVREAAFELDPPVDNGCDGSRASLPLSDLNCAFTWSIIFVPFSDFFVLTAGGADIPT